jgi:beta-lactamase regulating signal transducer with metallopeptidase domain
MRALFLKLLNMSISAGWLILAVAALRLLLQKAPRRLLCALWAAVALRLLCPFSIESALSLLPSAETVSPEIVYAQKPAIESGVPVINRAVNPVLQAAAAPAPTLSAVSPGVSPLQFWTSAAAWVWLAGMAAMLIYAGVSYLQLRRKIAASLPVKDNIRICDEIETPFILGVFHPKIYLPSSLDEAQMPPVIAHETAHLKRGDNLWKPLGFLLLAVYWFQPLCWLAYILFCRDVELACDEKAVRAMSRDEMIAYSRALLSCSLPKNRAAISPLAFGEVGVKERVKHVLHDQKSAFWLAAMSAAACIAVAVCFLTNPVKDKGAQAGKPQSSSVSLTQTAANKNTSAQGTAQSGAEPGVQSAALPGTESYAPGAAVYDQIFAVPQKARVSVTRDAWLIAADDGTLVVWGGGEANAQALTQAEWEKRGYQPLAYADRRAVLPNCAGVWSDGFTQFGLDKNYNLYGWGTNLFGRLPDGNEDRPALLLTDVALADMGEYGLALKTDGSVWVWGQAYAGKLGTGRKRVPPTRMLDGAVCVCAGSASALAVLKDGGLCLIFRNPEQKAENGTDPPSAPRYLGVQAKDLAEVSYCYNAGGYLLRKTDGSVCLLADADASLGAEPIARNVRALAAGGYLTNDNALWVFSAAGKPAEKAAENVSMAIVYDVPYLEIKTDGAIWTNSGSAGELEKAGTMDTLAPDGAAGH